MDDDLGTRLALHRATCRYTRTQAGEAAGVSRQTIFSYETGRHKPGIRALFLLAELYQLNDGQRAELLRLAAADG